MADSPDLKELIDQLQRPIALTSGRNRLYCPIAVRRQLTYITHERLARASASPTWSDPEGSSHNEPRLGRCQPLTSILLRKFEEWDRVKLHRNLTEPR